MLLLIKSEIYKDLMLGIQG